MRQPHIDEHVRVTHEIPELSLRQGDRGVVRSIWCSPNNFYEIEFDRDGTDLPDRCLVPAGHVEIDEEFSAAAGRENG
ncbi:MAG TPA: hypothetical protein VHD56_01985 [Tepidisphaeraceae bacterium]|nr:hypothetical protein [Tepidisphaeraceae bacterium]